MPRVLVSVLFGVVLSACADTDRTRVEEYLDPETAVTIRAMAVPIVFAHEAPELAANARDYVSAGLVEVNNMGKRDHYLVLVSATTVDRHRPGVDPAAIPGRVEILIGGKPREFTPVTHEPRSLGVGTVPFRPASGFVGESWYRMTVSDLRALAEDPPQAIGLIDDPANRIDFELWRPATEELKEFVRDIPDARPVEATRH